MILELSLIQWAELTGDVASATGVAASRVIKTAVSAIMTMVNSVCTALTIYSVGRFAYN